MLILEDNYIAPLKLKACEVNSAMKAVLVKSVASCQTDLINQKDFYAIS